VLDLGVLNFCARHELIKCIKHYFGETFN
jgi:hypothetical protein